MTENDDRDGKKDAGSAAPSSPPEDNRPTQVDAAPSVAIESLRPKPMGGTDAAAPAGADAASDSAKTQTHRAVGENTPPPPNADELRPAGEGEGRRSSVPPPGIRVRYYGSTDVGLVREHNEDNFVVADFDKGSRGSADGIQTCSITNKGAIFAVCDGMGGAAAGEVASQLAVDTIHELIAKAGPFKDRDSFATKLVRSIEEAGARIFAAGRADRRRQGMGTTSTVSGLIDKVLFVGQVGDSRAYLVRRGEVKLITKDQSLANQLIEAGQLTEEQAESWEHSNIILQALGTTGQVSVDLTFLELRRGDRLLLCSDGLSGLVHAEMIKEVLVTTPDLMQCCEKLIGMANAGGGHDNITVVICEFDGDGLEPPTADSPATYQQYPLPILPESRPAPPGIPGTGSHSSISAPRAADTLRGRNQKTLFMVLGIGLLLIGLLVVVGVMFVLPKIAAVSDASNDPGNEPASIVAARPAVQADPTPEVAAVQAAPAPAAPAATVVVHSDVVDGELWVNGVRRSVLDPNTPTELQLTAEPYLLEARSRGTIVASANINPQTGSKVDVDLNLPQGSDNSPVARREVDGGARPARARVNPRADAGVAVAVAPRPVRTEPVAAASDAGASTAPNPARPPRRRRADSGANQLPPNPF